MYLIESLPSNRLKNRTNCRIKAMKKSSTTSLFCLMLMTWTFQTCVSEMSSIVPPNLDSCENVTEIDIYNFFERNAPPSHWIRPVKSFGKSVGISIELALRSVLGLDTLNQELFLTGFLFLTWTDEYRIWNTIYPLNCVDTVSLEFGVNTKIWAPDICFYNS